MTIEFSDARTSGFFRRRPLALRTGSNHDDDGSAGDTESGGQPLEVSVSFQVRAKVRVRVRFSVSFQIRAKVRVRV